MGGHKLQVGLLASGLYLFASVALAANRDGVADAPSSPPTTQQPRPAIGLTALGGVAFATCVGQSGACTDSPSPGPSLRALVLYEPSRSFGFGVLGRVSSFHWNAGYRPFTADPQPSVVQSDITTAFVGLSGRFTAFPEWTVSPVVEAALGSVFQSQTRSGYGCSNGFHPGGELALGARARVAPWGSVLVMADGALGLADTCGVSDGAPATPFLGSGFGLHAGFSFDVAIGRPAPSRIAGR